MADDTSSTDDWEQFFQSLVDILNECDISTVNNSVDREDIAARLEHAVLVLQQILPLLPGASVSVEYFCESSYSQARSSVPP